MGFFANIGQSLENNVGNLYKGAQPLINSLSNGIYNTFYKAPLENANLANQRPIITQAPPTPTQPVVAAVKTTTPQPPPKMVTPSVTPPPVTPKATPITPQVNPTSLPQFQGAPPQIANLIAQSAQKYGVPLKFAAAVANHESAGTFSPTIKNKNGDGGIGPFQITPGVGNQYVDSLTPAQRLDPTYSVDAGMRTLADAYKIAMQRFGKDPDPTRALRDAYMIFNAGPNYTASKTPLAVLRDRANKVVSLFNQ